MTDLGTLGGAIGEARSVNASGRAAGKSRRASQEMHATLWITRG